MILSSKIQQISPSLTLSLNEKTRQLKAAGQDIINFAAGESCLLPPLVARQAAHQAVDSLRYYTAVEGTLELRSAISDYMWRHSKLQYSVSEIIVSTGCKQSLFNLLYVLLNKGDEVIIPTPYWTSYPEMVLACEGQPVYVATNEQSRYLPSAQMIAGAISSKTKMIILNSPHNPSSQVLHQKDLELLADLLIHYPHIFICCDDIYDALYLGPEKPPHLLEIAPELKERSIIINGLSKSHAMSGWRLGFAAGPTEIIKAMIKLQSQSTSNPCVIAQAAAIAAFDHADAELEQARIFYRQQHAFFQQNMTQKIPSLSFMPAEAGFYAWLDMRSFIEKGGWKNDLELAQDCLSHSLVSFVPGTAFGQPGFIRMAVTESEERIAEGINRFAAFLKERHVL